MTRLSTVVGRGNGKPLQIEAGKCGREEINMDRQARQDKKGMRDEG
jgi:hypothetical protein